MDISPPPNKNKYLINSYGFKGFEINHIFYQKTILLTPDNVQEIEAQRLEDIDLVQLQKFIGTSSEILLIGNGALSFQPRSQLIQQIKLSLPQLSISQMTSAAACRTYNFLLAEDRNVAAILLPVPNQNQY